MNKLWNETIIYPILILKTLKATYSLFTLNHSGKYEEQLNAGCLLVLIFLIFFILSYLRKCGFDFFMFFWCFGKLMIFNVSLAQEWRSFASNSNLCINTFLFLPVIIFWIIFLGPLIIILVTISDILIAKVLTSPAPIPLPFSGIHIIAFNPNIPKGPFL